MSSDLLGRMSAALASFAIPHMLTGSFAAAWYGAGRATVDIDLVIAPTSAQLRSLIDEFSDPDRYYVSLEAAMEAQRNETQFNVIDISSGWKVDLIIRKSRLFSLAEFDRRVEINLDGIQTWIATAEDLVLAKLEWAKLGASARQLEDVSQLLRLRGDRLDSKYLAQWIEALDVAREWEMARRWAP